jgi:DNA polymerase-3 subunit gamma/tau
MARILAAALNCGKGGVGGVADACGACESCVAVSEDRSLALLEIDAASYGGIDDVRRIRELTAYDVGAAYRVVAFDEAHMLSRPAFNALLAVLEEPPPRTVFVLLTTEPHRIPDTVISRAMHFDFRRIPVAGIVERLRHICTEKGWDVADDLLTEIAERVEGGMRDAVKILDQCSYVGVTDAAAYRERFGHVEVGVPLFTAALDGDYARGMKIIDDYFYRSGDATEMVNELIGVMRDVLVVLVGAEPDRDATALSERRGLAERVTVDRLVAAVRTLWELKARTRTADDAHRAQMEMAFVILAEAIAEHPIETVEEVRAEEPLRTREQLEALVASLGKEEPRAT